MNTIVLLNLKETSTTYGLEDKILDTTKARDQS